MRIGIGKDSAMDAIAILDIGKTHLKVALVAQGRPSAAVPGPQGPLLRGLIRSCRKSLTSPSHLHR